MNRDLPKLTTGEYRITERKISPKKPKKSAKNSPVSSPKKSGDPTQLVVEINAPVVLNATKSDS